MSHEEFLAWLIEIGCGWLNWRPDEVMNADMSDVLLAYEGKVKMLEAVYGGGRKAGPKHVGSVHDFDAAFG